jgi:hypothetical protein
MSTRVPEDISSLWRWTRTDDDSGSKEGDDVEYMSEEEIGRFAAENVGRPIVVVGASTGSDTHSVGIDAMLNLKGYHGHHGLEGYKGFETHNLGSQVPNSVSLRPNGRSASNRRVAGG